MKQVTGNKTSVSANKVSIQLALDGHSFSVVGLDGEFEGIVQVEVLSPRTLLVPRELFEADKAGALLAAAGLPALADDCVVWSDAQAEVVAVMAAGHEAIAAVVDRFGDGVCYTTPLLAPFEAARPTVGMHRTTGLLYIKVYDGSLREAGVIPAASEADVAYFTERLAAQYAVAGFVLRLSGIGTKELQRLIGKRFKSIVCES